MTYQTFKQWQQSPVQGAIPLPQSEGQKEAIYDALATALPCLQTAHDAAKHLKVSHEDLYMAICDALNACNESLERLTDAPDDVAIPSSESIKRTDSPHRLGQMLAHQ